MHLGEHAVHEDGGHGALTWAGYMWSERKPAPGEGKRHQHLLLTQHLPNFGTESEVGVETMRGERSSRRKGPARPDFSWEEI